MENPEKLSIFQRDCDEPSSAIKKSTIFVLKVFFLR